MSAQYSGFDNTARTPIIESAGDPACFTHSCHIGGKPDRLTTPPYALDEGCPVRNANAPSPPTTGSSSGYRHLGCGTDRPSPSCKAPSGNIFQTGYMLGGSMVASPAASPSVQAILFHGLADPSRLSCLLAVRESSKTVGEIVATTRLSQPTCLKASRLPS